MVSIQPRPCDILLVAAAGLSMTCSPLRSTIWSAPPPRSSPTYWWHSRDSGRAELRGERRVVSTGRRDSTSWRSKARSAALMATPSISSRATSSWPKGSRWWNPRWQPQDPPHRGPARLPGPLLPLRPRQTVGARHLVPRLPERGSDHHKPVPAIGRAARGRSDRRVDHHPSRPLVRICTWSGDSTGVPLVLSSPAWDS